MEKKADKKDEKMSIVSTVNFNAKTNKKDQNIMQLLNQLCSLPNFRSYTPTQVARAILEEVVPKRIEEQRLKPTG